MVMFDIKGLIITPLSFIVAKALLLLQYKSANVLSWRK